MNWLDYLTGLGILIGISGAIGTAVVLLRSTTYKTTVELLNAEVQAYKGRLDTLEYSETACKEALARIRSEHEYLKALLPSGPHISEIKSYMDARFDEMIVLLGGRPPGHPHSD